MVPKRTSTILGIIVSLVHASLSYAASTTIPATISIKNTSQTPQQSLSQKEPQTSQSDLLQESSVADEIVGGRCRKKKGKKAPKVTINHMSYEQLKELKSRLVAQKKTDAAIKCLDKMLPLCNDASELKTIMIELADLLFDHGKLAKAESIYTEFAKLYPGSNNIETVLYKALLCAYYSTLDADRDQTKTYDALALAKKFLERETVFTTYAQDVRKIENLCHGRLFESEEQVIQFYINRGTKKDFIAAHNRIDAARTTYQEKIPETEPRLLALECNLAERQKDYAYAEKKQLELAQKYPDYQTKTTLAQADKSNFINRF